ncbi:unnamed protein product [Macrosiphum euphorbiae]|uniref:Peptidase M13 C-terminal domain-containing protein n=1 Tax=Macrosiphum euphorbiae TaxID=13131 RepID=A0AAV0WMT6_9HEMI|nr:unnamed protein product [Macrosiphum euphorbiae]
MNYGAIGFVIGHEITHGFDDQGRKYDKQGNLVDWWARKTKKRFLEKVLCIIKQYGNYTVDEVGLKVCCVQFWYIMITFSADAFRGRIYRSSKISYFSNFE